MLAQKLTACGWSAAGEETWEHLVRLPPFFAFLAPPLDSIPSRQGNAIYTLVERLVEKLPLPTIALACYPTTGQPTPTPISDRILYYRGSLTPTLAERSLPYRLRKRLWGTGVPSLLNYPRAAAQACQHLVLRGLVVEDHPIFCAPVRAVAPRLKLLLHQHIDAPVNTPIRHWKAAVHSLDGIVFVAQHTRQVTEARHGSISVPAWVVYNGVDLHAYDPALNWERAQTVRAEYAIPLDAPVLLFIGRMVPGKGPAEAVEAFNRAAVPDAHMLVVGDVNVFSIHKDDRYLQRLRLAAAANPARVHLVGSKAQADVPPYYAAADLVIVPTIQSEGLPKVVTEALAMGKPVLASDRGGIWELLEAGRNAHLIPDPSDVSAMAALIGKLLGDREMLARMSANILVEDRPRMDEGRMVEEFRQILGMWV